MAKEFRVGDVLKASGSAVGGVRQFRVTAVGKFGMPTLRLIPLDETPAELAARAKEARRRANAHREG
jgi:hypothetical protein